VAIVGLDRELSREALIRYQLRELAGVATYEALPAQRPAALEPGRSRGQATGELSDRVRVISVSGLDSALR
jgi:hypothetical protein